MKKITLVLGTTMILFIGYGCNSNSNEGFAGPYSVGKSKDYSAAVKTAELKMKKGGVVDSVKTDTKK